MGIVPCLITALILRAIEVVGKCMMPLYGGVSVSDAKGLLFANDEGDILRMFETGSPIIS